MIEVDTSTLLVKMLRPSRELVAVQVAASGRVINGDAVEKQAAAPETDPVRASSSRATG